MNCKLYAGGLSLGLYPFSKVLLIENNMQMQKDKGSKQMHRLQLHKQVFLTANK